MIRICTQRWASALNKDRNGGRTSHDVGPGSAAAYGTAVPAGLTYKVKSGCPDLLKPEPLAAITKGSWSRR